MSFIRSNFTNVNFNQSKTPNEFAYITTDTISTVLGTGYFNELYDMVAVGDIIRVHASNAITFTKVSANAAKVVTIVDGTNII
jgi:hypothetical protein